MDALAVLAAILLWFVVLAVALMRTPGGTVRSLIAPWFVLTGLTMALEFIALFILVHILLFTFGDSAGGIALLASLVILVATPVAWGLILRRRARHAAAH